MIPRLRSFLRNLAAGALFSAGLTLPGRAAAGRLMIATFHRVLPDTELREYPLHGLAVTPAEFRWFLAFFGRHFSCGPLGDIADRWARGESPGRPFLALTFDDGQLDNFLYARPILEEAELRATFFVPVDAVDRRQPLWHDELAFAVSRLYAARPEAALQLLAELEAGRPGASSTPRDVARTTVLAAKRAGPAARREWAARARELLGRESVPAWSQMMSWDQLRHLVAEGHEVASHSLTHEILTQLGDGEIEAEVGVSRTRIEAEIDAPVETFCYPDGDYDERVLGAVKRSGYRYAVTTRWGPNEAGCPPLELRRNDMVTEHVRGRDGAGSEALLAWRLSGFHPGLR
jgi:peptidoglycan/xylan/chitin deacetylase (PgdA/CDA1 family)